MGRIRKAAIVFGVLLFLGLFVHELRHFYRCGHFAPLLARGQQVKLNTNGIGGVGTLGFIIPAFPNQGGATLSVQAVPGGGALTTLTASLQVGSDNVTFKDLVASGSFISNTAL